MSHQILIEVQRGPANKLAACGYGESIHHHPRKTMKVVTSLRRNVRFSRGLRRFSVNTFTTGPPVTVTVTNERKCLL